MLLLSSKKRWDLIEVFSLSTIYATTHCVSVMLILDFKQNKVYFLFFLFKCFACVSLYLFFFLFNIWNTGQNFWLRRGERERVLQTFHNLLNVLEMTNDDWYDMMMLFMKSQILLYHSSRETCGPDVPGCYSSRSHSLANEINCFNK